MDLQHSRPHRVGATAQAVSRTQVLSWFWRALGFAFLATLLFASYLTFVTVRDHVANSPFNLSDPALPPIVTSEPDATPVPELPRWSGNERINVLLMGIDQREGEEGPWRTDTLIVLTLDPVTLNAGMLSIPRDLWVTIPAYEVQERINKAHFIGDAYDYPGGGPALARDTVTWNLGIPIHFYARVNFTAFETLIDEIGGIDIYVPKEIEDPDYPDALYGFDPFYIEAGQHHLDGKTALKYARTRATFGGDFDRGARQQAVIMAVRDQVVKLDQLPRLISRAPTLLDILGEALVTDMGLEQAIQLAKLAMDVDPEQIVTAVIDQNYISFGETPDGDQVLIPNREAMRELRDLIFFGPQTAGGAQTGTERLAEENARLVVLNGSNVPGLARRTSDYLSDHGFQVAQIGDASSQYDHTLIMDYAGKRFTSRELATLLKLPVSSVIAGGNPEGEYDVALILGADFSLPED